LAEFILEVATAKRWFRWRGPRGQAEGVLPLLHFGSDCIFMYEPPLWWPAMFMFRLRLKLS